MASQTVLSLAVLQVNWDKRGKDYLENFIPMVAECIRLSKDDFVSSPQLRRDLETQFGLRFPDAAIDTILKRLRKRDYLRVENQTYFRNLPKLATLNFHETQQKIITMHDTLIRSMIDFCKATFNVDCTTNEAETSLLGFLKENDLLIMSAVTTGTLIPDLPPTTKSIKYYVAKYIRHLQDTASPELSYLHRLIEGNMLANAIFLPDPNRAGQKFQRTKLFFDTTFLIYALGYGGKPRQEPCAELLNMLYESGADLRCFPHTVDEIINILDACSRRMKAGVRSDQYGTVDYFIEREYSDSDIQLLINNLPKNLQSIRVQIEAMPPYTPMYVIDELALSGAFDDEIHYVNPQANKRDVDSISAIMRLRHLQSYYYVENCCALFVTTNSRLAKAVRMFFHRNSSERVVSSCITDSSLTTLLWLKKPLQMPDLPMKRIIADCYAALQPDEQLIQAYLTKIKQLEQNKEITPDEVLMLRYSLEARQALMDLTSGDEDAFTHITVQEVLELVRQRVEQKWREEIQAKANTEIQNAKNAFEAAQLKTKAEIHTTINELESIKNLLAQKDLHLIQASDTIQGFTALQQVRDTNIIAKANKVARFIGFLFKIFLILIIILGIFFSLPWKFPPIPESPFRYGIAAVLFVFGLLSTMNLLRGTTINSIARSIEIKCRDFISNFLRSLTA